MENTLKIKMKQKALVSVIVPIYNSEKTLSKCINSILAQDYKNFELILVDNNSTDSTKEIIKEFQKSSKKIRYVFEPIKGRGKARNTGVKSVNKKSEVILMTDSDCIVPKNWIKNLIIPLINENEKIVEGFEEDFTNNNYTKLVQKDNKNFMYKHVRKINSKLYSEHLDTKNFAAKKEILKKYKFDENLKALEDFELALRLKKSNIKIRFLPKIKVKHFHPLNLKKIAKTNFGRGYWAKIVYDNYKKNTSLIRDTEMFKSISIKNYIKFPLWAIYQIFKNPPRDILYLLTKESSWRLGIIAEMIKTLNKSNYKR